MDQPSIFPSSDFDEDENDDFNLLTVVNEHSEVIGLIENDKETNSPIWNRNEIEILHHPPDIPESDSDGNNSLGDKNVEENDSDSEVRNITLFAKTKIVILRTYFLSLKYHS